MVEALYMDDSYLKEFEAKVVGVKDGKYVVLDRTAFYPRGGGLPWDTGKFVRNGEEFNVVFVGKFDGEISHEVDKPGLKEGDVVKGFIDWDARYKVIRYHTAAHILSAVLHREAGAKITGNQVSVDKLRVDFDLEKFDKEELERYVGVANAEIQRELDVKSYYLDREEAMKIPGIVKLAGALPPSVERLRVVEIGDVDLQADGGPHVRNTREIGELVLVKAENKGKNNRRIYLEIKK
jgi:misacylated tRNA(Ala) deacylase